MALGRRPRGVAALAALLLVLGVLAGSARAIVVLQTGNFSLSFADMPADFGPSLPPDGITGLLLLADPADACTDLKPPPRDVKAPWVALIARSQDIEGCTFDVKVAHAEAAGAAAAIIHDDAYEPLVLMAKDPRHPDPFIPSVFVSQRSGLMMRRLTQEGKTVVELRAGSEALWLSMVLSAAAGFLAVNVVLGALWMVRRQHAPGGAAAAGYGSLQPRQGMTADEIRALPVVVFEGSPAQRASVASSGTAASLQGQAPDGGGGSSSSSSRDFKGGGTRHACAICLEDYEGGDKMRVLPCQHRFHSECVDQWLSNRHPVCPVCKADAHPPATGGGDLEEGGMPSRWQRRGARLLAPLAAGWAALRGLGNGGADAGVSDAAAAALLPGDSTEGSETDSGVE
ncbi:receptor homology transmembrane domain-and RING domain-containing 2-like isoform X1 [Micractinium conductrix]|uniref:RING-type E3 ubiquitin transferase n=1 Tax=Micractinium conductrix TaxID=554055 RepID=A0A2P6VGX5_9CHLO|nr:receptor homology transmembrane domain-and RING domain-containing 2-like isoform X1 [Micractinium conductrix]|eukprot:PSC73339.1 receptor homology transmembrane domain-and RING domain-containing 2-like isoform X1 [Micractinium conductrix]